MSLFKRLFGKNSGKDSKPEGAEQRGKFMPEVKLPTDEKFTINFKKNGGKFLYCDSIDEIHDCFANILQENQWNTEDICCLDDSLKKSFQPPFKLPSRKNCRGAEAFLSRCEYLVADNGSLLISSNQIGESKLNELPGNFVIFATTSQLIDNIGEGLRGIKSKNRSVIPTNITTIKNFTMSEEKDFLTYGSSSKNLYLLLLEDL
ncbi:LUD domain-containing protein [Robertkochia aurantiaca]|uniref:LUD domain-containing protein n=1 Tax=Robertkochia aurantiaca TaxID=2873700 RepID=UPI001CCC7A77|nr:LUD domain-containing protein [Robertkochia sp. 3YJGBD-33]